MLGKKGISPLIITILLIAFAVALGTMIMNWTSGVVSASEVACEDIILEVQSAFNKEILCYDDTIEKMRLVMKNRGSSPIDFIIYRRIGADLRPKDVSMPDSYLKQGKIYEADISFQYTDKIHVEFIPGIMKGGEEVLCPDAAIVRENLPKCGV